MARIDDGHSTRMTFSAASSVEFYEKEVTPPGVSAGGPNDTTTMQNSTWRTMAPKQLKTLTPANLVAAYDPAVYDTIVSMCGVNQQITITFADSSTLVFWGWLDEFKPNRVVEGAQPTAEVTIHPSNQNDSGVETAPNFTASV